MFVLLESMYDSMMGVKVEGYFDLFFEGVIVMVMVQFCNKVGNYVFGMNLVGVMMLLLLVFVFKGDVVDWKVQYKFCFVLGESVKWYQYVEGFFDYFIEQLIFEVEKYGLFVLILLNNIVYGMFKSDREL